MWNCCYRALVVRVVSKLSFNLVHLLLWTSTSPSGSIKPNSGIFSDNHVRIWDHRSRGESWVNNNFEVSISVLFLSRVIELSMAGEKNPRCEKTHAMLWSLCVVSVFVSCYLLYKDTLLESRLEALERQFASIQHGTGPAAVPVPVPGELMVERLRREVNRRSVMSHSRVARDLSSDCSCQGQSTTEYYYKYTQVIISIWGVTK